MEGGPWDWFVHTSQWTIAIACWMFCAFICIAAFGCMISFVFVGNWRFWKT